MPTGICNLYWFTSTGVCREMITHLEGRLSSKSPPHVVIDVQGVGYEVETPMSTAFRLPESGQPVRLLTHMVVREDAHLLYGFGTAQERSLFRTLLKVSGIGPRIALAVLSGVTMDEFWGAVRTGEAGRLVKVPGVGAKTAARILMEMKGREKAGEGDASRGVQPIGAREEARSALLALGYKPMEAQTMVDAAAQAGMSTESIIQSALRRAMR